MVRFPDSLAYGLSVSFDAPKHRPSAVEIGLDLRTRAREARHNRADRHALDFCNLPVGQALEHYQQQRGALVIHQRRERTRDVASTRFGTGQIRGIILFQRGDDGTARQRAQAIAVEIGQDCVEPAAHIAAVKEMLRAKRPHQRVLHEIVGQFGVVSQRPGIAPQRRNCTLDALLESAHRHPPALQRHPLRFLPQQTLACLGYSYKCKDHATPATPACRVPWPYVIEVAGRIRRSEDSMAEASALMRGKRGLIMGVANNRSIAWGIAKACREQGAELAFTYQGDALKKRVEPLAEELGGFVVGHCDVSEAATLDAVFNAIAAKWGALDFVVHAIAFSDKDELTGRYVDTTADNFARTMLISCYSFTAVAQRAEKLMEQGGSLLTLTYYGAEKWMPHYNVMGVAKAALEASVRYLAADLGSKNIRVNAISAGPIKTLAASGIGDFRYILKWNEYNAPLRRSVTTEEVGGSALYLLSDMSRGVTGEVHHVDSGYHVVGMKRPDAPDISLAKGE